MTRDECLGAISTAFGGVYVWAFVGFWNVIIETSPKRELVLTNWFVHQNIDKDGLRPEEFVEILRSIKENDWFKAEDGSLLKVYGFPSNLGSLVRDSYPAGK